MKQFSVTYKSFSMNTENKYILCRTTEYCSLSVSKRRFKEIIADPRNSDVQIEEREIGEWKKYERD